MTALAPARAIAFLCRVGLFAAVLALIAGIFGMHVMTATHALHSPATVSVHHGSSPAGHTGGHASGPVSAAALPAVQGAEGSVTEPCGGSGNCSGMQSATGSCIPSAKTGSLAAPLPGAGIIGRNVATETLIQLRAQWSYHPGSPSPGDLCIIRT